MRRRLLLALLFGLVVIAGAAVAWQAKGQAGLAERDLVEARRLLGQAGGFQGGELAARLDLIDQATTRAGQAQARLDGWPLRQLGVLPLVGRDVRVARSVAASARGVIAQTRRVVTALQPLQTRPPARETILAASKALLELQRTLDFDAERVRSTRALLTGSARAAYLAQVTAAGQAAGRAGQGLKLAASLYGPPGTARWFLAFQNPAELRGTGGLIGQYGILESGPDGPELASVASYEELDRRTRRGIKLERRLAPRYERFAVDRAWSAVNIPPDLPSVGRIITRLYEQTTGDRIDGVIAADPLAVAEVLRASGPVEAGGVRLTADNVVEETLVRAYVRHADDNTARRRFLEQVARRTFEAFRVALAEHPVTLVRGLAAASGGRHLQVYARDRAGQAALVELGLGGTSTAPPTGDYLMPVGINAGGNKLDTFLHRSLDWRVRLAADGSATARASVTLRNAVDPAGLPRYVIGPFDERFQPAVNEQIQTLYVARDYGFTKASLDGRRVGAQAQADLGGLALTQAIGVPAGASSTVGYRLQRPGAASRLDDVRLRYQLLLRPQATVRPDRARVVVLAPAGWRFAAWPAGGRVAGASASWSGSLDRERALVFDLAPA